MAVIVLFCTCHSLASIPPFPSSLSSFNLPSVTHSLRALCLPAANLNGTSLSRCAVMHPPMRKNTHSALGGVLRTQTSYVYSCHFSFSLPPCWVFSSSSLSLVSQTLRVWSLLSGGTRGQLNIYGSPSIQMFGNGESL